MNKTTFTISTLLLCILLAACSGGPGSPRKADTPLHTLESMSRAISDGDAKAYAACFDTTTAAQAEMLTAMGECTIAADKFHKAMTVAYGPDAVSTGSGMMGAPSTRMTAKDWLADAQVKIEGDTAIITVKGEKQPLELVRKGGIWKVKTDKMFGRESEQDLQKSAKFMQALAESSNEARAKVGKPGYTAAKINAELQASQFGKMMGPMD